MAQSAYTKTYTSFSGSDIVATFNKHVIGELQAITYSVTREKAPIYTMGDPNPRSFSRGKRGIAGSLVFTVFDRDALDVIRNESTISTHSGAGSRVPGEATAVNDISDTYSTNRNTVPKYTDEIPPFDITINFLNEYGQSAVMTIYGVEILNEGMGMSIDDITTEKACTFVARDITVMKNQ